MPTNPSPPTTRQNRRVDPVKAALEKARPPAWMAKYKNQDAGKGISRKWEEDHAYWLTLTDDEAIDWIEAIKEVDQTGDEDQLLALLRSDRWLPPRGRFHLDDLIERQGLKKKRNGRPRTPSYDVSGETVRLKFVVDEVRLHSKELTRRQAIEYAAKRWNFTESTIEHACRGSHRSLHRLEKLLAERDLE
jgi:hypothetical protein